jgi:hypothetical protein
MRTGARRRQAGSRQGSTGASPPQTKPKHPWLRIVGRIVAVLVTAATLLFGFVKALGPPWPTLPIVQPNSAPSSPYFTLPFQIKNEGYLFDMHDVELACKILKVTLASDDNSNLVNLFPAVMTGAAWFGGAFTEKAEIRRNGGVINFPCTASNGLRNVELFIVPSGQRIRFNRIRAMTVVIGYRLVQNMALLNWHREGDSTVFSRVDTPAGPQWFEGEVVTAP